MSQTQYKMQAKHIYPYLYIFVAFSYFWNCLKCCYYIILPCAKLKNAYKKVAILGQFSCLR